MRAPWVYRGSDGKLQRYNGVTRATRIVKLSPGTLIRIEVVGNLAAPLRPVELAKFPLIDTEWLARETWAPGWQLWQKVAARRHKLVPDLSSLPALSFREELHAIEAAIAGQGLAICSDVLVGPELTSGVLVPVSRITLPGLGFYIVHRPSHPKLGSIKAFIEWARSAVAA